MCCWGCEVESEVEPVAFSAVTFIVVTFTSVTCTSVPFTAVAFTAVTGSPQIVEHAGDSGSVLHNGGAM